MKKCIVCKEKTGSSSTRCKKCKDAFTAGTGTMKLNKWKVPIQKCNNGHSYVPVNGECLPCKYNM